MSARRGTSPGFGRRPRALPSRARTSFALPVLGSSLLALLLLAGGCAGPQVSVRKDFDFGRVRRVAVLDFMDLPDRPGSGAVVGRAFEQSLLDAGWQVVERQEAERILAEQAFSVSGAVDQRQAREIGRLLGVDALLLGVVTDYIPSEENLVLADVRHQRTTPIMGRKVRRVREGDRWVDQPQDVVTGYKTEREKVTVPQTVFTDALVGTGVKMVYVETGEVLWSGSFSLKRSSMTQALQELSSRLLRSAGKKGARVKG